MYCKGSYFQIPHVKIVNYSRSRWSWRNLRQKRKFYSKNTMIKESPPSKVNHFHSPFILTNFAIVVRCGKQNLIPFYSPIYCDTVTVWTETHHIYRLIHLLSSDFSDSSTFYTTRMAKANLLNHNCAIPVIQINAFYYLPLEIDCILI